MWTPICIVWSAAWNGQAKCRLCRSISVNAYACVVYVYNVISALYSARNNHFCVIRVSFVATSRLTCRWICDSPGTGCAWRLTPTYMWREHAKTKAQIYVPVTYVNFVEIIIAFPNGGQWAPLSKVCSPWLKPLVTPLPAMPRISCGVIKRQKFATGNFKTESMSFFDKNKKWMPSHLWFSHS